jgi:hypothetical protein
MTLLLSPSLADDNAEADAGNKTGDDKGFPDATGNVNAAAVTMTAEVDRMSREKEKSIMNDSLVAKKQRRQNRGIVRHLMKQK